MAQFRMRAVQVQQESDPEILWQESASCGDADPEDFEPKFHQGRNGRGRSIEENQARFRRASEICKGCPVLDQCKENSTPADLWYTYRAGKEPGVYTNYLKMSKVQYLTRTTRLQGQCKNGHDDWVIWGGRPKCKTCDADRRASRIEAKGV